MIELLPVLGTAFLGAAVGTAVVGFFIVRSVKKTGTQIITAIAVAKKQNVSQGLMSRLDQATDGTRFYQKRY